MRGLLVIALLSVSGCRTGPAERSAPVPSAAPRRVFIAPFELEPKDAPEAGRRLARQLDGLVRERVQALGHELAGRGTEAELHLALGAALEFHPAGDVKVIRLFLRVEEGEVLLEDWAREPMTFYFLPPTKADLEALADEVAARLAARLDPVIRSR